MSSPLLYLLIAFAYLLVFSTGFFSEKGEKAADDVFTSNIINYETLDAEADNYLTDTQLFHFSDYIENSKFHNDDASARNEHSLTKKLIGRSDSPPTYPDNLSFAKYTTELFNRPPPACVA